MIRMLNIFFLLIIISHVINTFGFANRIQYICTYNNYDYYNIVNNFKFFESNWLRNESTYIKCDRTIYYAECKNNITEYIYRKKSTKFRRLPWYNIDLPKEPGLYQSEIHDPIVTYDYLCVPNYVDSKSSRRIYSRIRNFRK